jgi:hypothetical protein
MLTRFKVGSYPPDAPTDGAPAPDVDDLLEQLEAGIDALRESDEDAATALVTRMLAMLPSTSPDVATTKTTGAGDVVGWASALIERGL